MWPLAWDIAFGGVCGVGEAWADAAARELAEEAGLGGPLERIGGGRWEGGRVREVAEVFLARTDDEPTCPDGEVVATARVPLVELDAWMAGRTVCPDSVALVGPHLRLAGDVVALATDPPASTTGAVRRSRPARTGG